MSTENLNRFDELIREKLSNYEPEPDMALLQEIHARKNRFLRNRNLYKLIILLAIVLAGITCGYYVKQQYQMNSNGVDANNKGLEETKVIPNQKQQSFLMEDQQLLMSSNSISRDAERTYSTRKVANGNLSLNNNFVYTKRAITSKPNQYILATNTDTRQHPISINEFPETRINANNTDINTDGPKETAIKNKSNEAINCNASFDFYAGYASDYHFMAYADEESSCYWNFGDGSTSAERKPVHRYKKPGNYQVTLTVIRPVAQCKAESFKSITVDKVIQETASVISGTVFADATYANKYRVELLVFNSEENQYELSQITFTNNKGYYEFKGVESGTYLIKSLGGANYKNTFYGNTDEQEYATAITIFDKDYSTLTGYDIQLKSMNSITQHASVNTDTSERWVLVFDETNKQVSSIKVNSVGEPTSAANLPAGKYTMVDPETGKISGKFEVGNTGTVNNTPTGNNSAIPFQEVTLAPNPASDLVRVGLSNSDASPIEITICNSFGAVVQKLTFNNANPAAVNINNLSAGTYYVLVKQNGITTSSRLIKSVDQTK
ncbi:MAG: PKD domain-containing protein [Bacteroidia bacterium]|jgi:PKD repeat protein|nr:PKD domain-containing protein [Bacteroidia bacterium]